MKIVVCLQCEEPFPLTEFNQWPEYSVAPDGKIKEILRDDFAGFIGRHRGHRITELRILNGPWSDRAYAEPVKTKYYEVAFPNGQSRVLRCSRERINEPMNYELLTGYIKTRVKQVKLDSEGIKKQLLHEQPSLGKKADAFIKILKTGLSSGVSIYGIDAVADRSESYESDHPHPLILLYKFASSFLLYIHRNIRHTLKDIEERKFMEGFIGRQSIPPDGLLMPKIEYGLRFVKSKR